MLLVALVSALFEWWGWKKRDGDVMTGAEADSSPQETTSPDRCDDSLGPLSF